MLILTGILESYRSLKDKTLKIVFETNEPTPEQLVSLVSNLQKYGYIAFKEDSFTTNEKKVLKDLKAEYNDSGKTPAQRLRSVLHVNWSQSPEGYDVFNDYYIHHMEKMITHWKNKLD